jgi:hypothetical protein
MSPGFGDMGYHNALLTSTHDLDTIAGHPTRTRNHREVVPVLGTNDPVLGTVAARFLSPIHPATRPPGNQSGLKESSTPLRDDRSQSPQPDPKSRPGFRFAPWISPKPDILSKTCQKAKSTKHPARNTWHETPRRSHGICAAKDSTQVRVMMLAPEQTSWKNVVKCKTWLKLAKHHKTNEKFYSGN